MAAGAHRCSDQEYIICNSLTLIQYGNRIKNYKQFINRDLCRGGGNFITQSAPTNFHRFYKRKILTADEMVTDFREVTDEQKAQLEAADAAWEEPDSELIRRWDDAWWPCSVRTDANRFGRYNSATGFFEAEGIADIDTLTAKRILDIGAIRSGSYNVPLYAWRVPVILPIWVKFWIYQDALCHSSVRVARFIDFYIGRGYNPDTHAIPVGNSQEVGYDSLSLRELRGVYDVADDKSYKNHFYNGLTNLASLEFLKIINLNKSLYLGLAKNFRIDCLDFIVENAKTVDAGQTIALHPDVYAKVSDELFGKASDKRITIATT